MLIAQAVNFVLVAFVIYRLASKVFSRPFRKEKQISDSLKHTEKIKLELEETERKQKETLQEASLEAKKTVTVLKNKPSRTLKDRRKMLASKQRRSWPKPRNQHGKKTMSLMKPKMRFLSCRPYDRQSSKELNDEENSRFSNAAAQELKFPLTKDPS